MNPTLASSQRTSKFRWLTFFIVLAGTSARANELTLNNAFIEFDRALATQTDYEAATEAATVIRDAGVEQGDAALEARGLMRLAFAELHFGRWNKRWEKQRDNALQVTEELSSPHIARAEVLMMHGYLLAMFLKEVDNGMDSLHESISIARALRDDALLAKTFYWTSRVLPFQGRMALACDYSYRAIRFAELANEPIPEFQATQYVLRYERDMNEEKRAAFLSRLERLSETCELVPWYTEEPFSEEELRQYMNKGIECLEKPATEHQLELKNGIGASTQLLKLLQREERWAESVEVSQGAKRLAEKIQDDMTILGLSKFAAMKAILDGTPEFAEGFLDELVAQRTQDKGHKSLAELYEMLAACASSEGADEVAYTWLSKATAHRKSISATTHSSFSANSFFDSEINSRKLQVKIASQDESLSRFRWLALLVPLIAVCLWLAVRSLRSKRQHRYLEKLVQDRTESLLVAKEEAEQHNRAKDEFLARINHELRNPLTAIIGSSELLSMSKEDNELREELTSTLQASTKHLLDLVDDVLDFTKIESGKLELSENVFAPKDLMTAVASIVRRQCKPAVELLSEVNTKVPDRVLADEAKLRQTLVNLGCNSAQQTETGHIRITCQFDEENRQLFFSVADTGCGISKERLQGIFESYTTGGNARGTGLGLYISSSFVNLMGGSLHAASEPDLGSTFSFAIPFRDASESPAHEKTEDAKPGKKRILVVDDEAPNRRVMTQLLEKLGYVPYVTKDWSEVEDVLGRTNVDIVLLDLRMPDIDGFGIAKLLRERLGSDAPPIYAMTGDATERTKKKAIEHGFHGMLPKPFLASAVRQVIESAPTD